MLGRRLDRYVTLFFIWHFVLCLVAILGLYVVVDTFSKLDDLVGHRDFDDQLRWMATYHLYQLPVLVSMCLPIVTLLAGIVSLARLARYNELNAIKAAGISMYRVLAPIFLAALGIAALAAANQEVLIPRIQDGIQFVRLAALKTEDKYSHLFVYDDEEEKIVFAKEFYTQAIGRDVLDLEAAAIVTPDPATPGTLPPAPSLRCKRAIWLDRWLFLFDGTTNDGKGHEKPFGRRMLLTTRPLGGFKFPDPPPSQLADGRPAHRVEALAALPSASYDAPGAASAHGAARNPRRPEIDPIAGHRFDVRFRAGEKLTGQQLIRYAHLTAREQTAVPIWIPVAFWYNGEWIARGETYAAVGEAQRRQVVYDGDPLPLSLTPQTILKTRMDLSLKSFGELRELAREAPKAARQRILVDLHDRIASPLASFVLLLVAIPFLFQHEGGKSTWISVGLALLLGAAFYAVTSACHVFGQDPEGLFAGMPALAAWLPILVFAVAGIILLANIDT